MENLELTGKRSPGRYDPHPGKTNRIKFFKSQRERIITISVVFGLLVVWELFARAGSISAIIFPAPTLILETLFTGIFGGRYTEDLYYTITRIVAGFFIGGGTGLVLGMIMGWSPPIRKVLDPIVAALHPLPKFSLLPMVILMFGIGESSRIAMVTLASFFPMLITTMTGVMQINPAYYEVVNNYGGNTFDEFRKVVFPGSLPFIMSGARLSLRSSLTITIGVEMIFSNTGLGSRLWLAWETMRLTHMWSILILISILGVSFTWILNTSKEKITPWHQERRPD
jgi:ABC-type nitrate/sulfonate/bicarbonate transport system permease component